MGTGDATAAAASGIMDLMLMVFADAKLSNGDWEPSSPSYVHKHH
jgi:hypothetical protein